MFRSLLTSVPRLTYLHTRELRLLFFLLSSLTPSSQHLDPDGVEVYTTRKRRRYQHGRREGGRDPSLSNTYTENGQGSRVDRVSPSLLPSPVVWGRENGDTRRVQSYVPSRSRASTPKSGTFTQRRTSGDRGGTEVVKSQGTQSRSIEDHTPIRVRYISGHDLWS